jgi:hypothetical protein
MAKRAIGNITRILRNHVKSFSMVEMFRNVIPHTKLFQLQMFKFFFLGFLKQKKFKLGVLRMSCIFKCVPKITTWYVSQFER